MKVLRGAVNVRLDGVDMIQSSSSSPNERRLLFFTCRLLLSPPELRLLLLVTPPTMMVLVLSSSCLERLLVDASKTPVLFSALFLFAGFLNCILPASPLSSWSGLGPTVGVASGLVSPEAVKIKYKPQYCKWSNYFSHLQQRKQSPFASLFLHLAC